MSNFDSIDIFDFLRDDRGPSTAPPVVLHTEASTEVRSTVKHVEERMDKLVLVCMAMWSLLRQNTQLTEEDLMDRVREIDLIDEKADGKVTRQIARCLKCKRVMSPRHTRCMYCGAEKLELTAFDGIV